MRRLYALRPTRSFTQRVQAITQHQPRSAGILDDLREISRLGVRLRRAPATGGGGGGPGGAARLAAPLFQDLAHAVDLEVAVVPLGDIEDLRRAVGVLDLELINLPSWNLGLIHVRDVHGDGLGAHHGSFHLYRRWRNPCNPDLGKGNHARGRWQLQAANSSSEYFCEERARGLGWRAGGARRPAPAGVQTANGGRPRPER